jgi:hypothetical protein
MHHPKHAILMPFEGPGILDHPTLTPEIGFDAGLALSQIHSLGTSHQDFAPWHVRVRDDGSVFFIDFSNLSMFDPHNLHAEIRDIKLQNNLLADIGDLVSMIEYAPNSNGLAPTRACKRAYRSTDFYKRLFNALLSAHQYTNATELCAILDSDDVDRSQVHVRQQLTLQSLADGITSVTRSSGPVFPAYPTALQLRITTELDGHAAHVTATIVSGKHVKMYLQSTEPPLDLMVSSYDALTRFLGAALAKAPADLCRRAEIERLCRRAESSTD